MDIRRTVVLGKEREFHKIPVLTYYLERAIGPAISTKENAAIPQLTREMKPLDEVCYLERYNAVGSPWGWSGRLLMGSDELRTFIDKPNVHILTPKVDGVEIGFVELVVDDIRAEITYFGLLDKFLGRSLGKPLMEAVRKYLAAIGVVTMWLHTCECDHPAALGYYKSCGFKVYKEVQTEGFYPIGYQKPVSRS